MPHDAITPRFSLVIPARNEEKYLPRVLETAAEAANRYRGGRESIEFIVADNVSTDRTAEVAFDFGCKVVTVEKRAIGAVRNGGAGAARGKYLCFADADNPLHPETFNAIDRCLERPGVVGGGTGGVHEKWTIGMAITYYVLYMPIVWVGQVDGGVVFCERADWEAVGGYDEQWLVSEDVRFLVKLKRHVKRRGCRLCSTKGAKVIISNRRFDLWGEWRTISAVPRLLWCWAFDREGLDNLSKQYWYSDRR